jgi:replicative DNA helicase
MDSNPNIGWQKALIGTVLHNPMCMEEALDLRPNDFTGSHQILWAIMLSLHTESRLEPRTLVLTIQERGLLEQISSFEDPNINGEAYIGEIIASRGGNISSYVDKVIGAAVRRSLLGASGIIQSYAQDAGLTYQEALDKSEERLLALRRDRSAGAGISMRDLMGVFVDRVDGMRSGDFVPAYEPRIQNIRSVVNYAEEDEFIIVAARPGDGKSSLLRAETFGLLLNGDPVQMFNLENSEIEYARAFVSMMTGINNQLLKRPENLTPEQYEDVIGASRRLIDMPLDLVSLGGPSIFEIDRIARAKLSKLEPKLITIDYAQLIMNPGSDNQNANVTTSSQKMRAMGRNYGVPIMAAAQLNRKIDERGKNSEPLLSDLRDSGSLEQDATQVWFIRPVWAEPTEAQLETFNENKGSNGLLLSKPPVRPMRVYIRKNRNGPSGVCDPIAWDMSNGRWRSLDLNTINLSEIQ